MTSSRWRVRCRLSLCYVSKVDEGDAVDIPLIPSAVIPWLTALRAYSTHGSQSSAPRETLAL